MKQALNRLALHCAAQRMAIKVVADGFAIAPQDGSCYWQPIPLDELADRIGAMNSAPIAPAPHPESRGAAAIRTLQRLGYTWEGGEQWAPPIGEPPAYDAPSFLEKAAGHMAERANTYDKPEGGRSMAQTVAVFNAFHRTRLTEAQGWHFMQVLKDVRLFTRPVFHRDSAEDGIAYAALKAEAKAGESPMAANDPSARGAANA